MATKSKTKRRDTGGEIVVALGEYDTGWQDPERSLSMARETAEQAQAAGAQLLVLPEMCTTGFTMEPAIFADPPGGPSTRALAALAKHCGLWIIAGLSTRRDERYFNSALAFAPDGSLVATYDKQRLFGYARETDVYSAGEAPCVIKVGGLSLGLFICFDLRFPELFREVGPDVDAFVVVANWPSARQRHWEILTQARAIENQCFVIAVNRIGEGDGLEYEGGSVILDPWGERRDEEAGKSSLRIGKVSHDAVAKVRKKFPLASSPRD